jgi:hypothetical protein
MATDLSAFQRVLEALLTARAMATDIVVSTDTTTRDSDDQDCYLRGIQLRIERTDPVWTSLRFLSKHLDWINLDTKTKHLHVSPLEEIPFRLARTAFQGQVATSLNEAGIPCGSDVYYR